MSEQDAWDQYAQDATITKSLWAPDHEWRWHWLMLNA